MKIAFIFSGQGSQVEGMGKDLYINYPLARDLYDSIEKNFKFPIKSLSFESELDIISKTENAQVILLVFHMIIYKILKEYAIEPDIVLGLSLGEYSALYAAGVVDEKEVFEIIRYRSIQMARASENLNSRMLAIFTEDLDKINKLLDKHSKNDRLVQVSNINTKGQIVISGDSELISIIEGEIKELGYKAVNLNTDGPFHTSYMDIVSDNLYSYFKDIDFKEAKTPIIYNYYGDFNHKGDIKEIMSKQVNNKVLFKSSLEKLLDKKPDLIVEIGHKNIISGFIRRLDRNTKVIAVNDLNSIGRLIEEVSKYGR